LPFKATPSFFRGKHVFLPRTKKSLSGERLWNHARLVLPLKQTCEHKRGDFQPLLGEVQFIRHWDDMKYKEESGYNTHNFTKNQDRMPCLLYKFVEGIRYTWLVKRK
jgi:hypothetical protein